MDDYLSKPYTRDQLSEVLGRWLPTANSESIETKTDDKKIEPVRTEESASEEILSNESLRELTELDPTGELNLVVRMLETFLTGTTSRVEELGRVLSDRDPEGVWRCAHWLKSSATNIGAHQLAELFRAIEERGRAGSVVGADVEFARALELYARVCVEVRRLLARRK